MKKKILVAVDDSLASKNAIRYAVHASTFVNGLHYTLFNVQPPVSLFLQDEAKKSVTAQCAIEDLKKRQTVKCLNILETHKAKMIEMGSDETCIDVKTRNSRSGLAKDILEYAQEVGYDAVVVGRRGLSRLQEFFMGSLTTNLLERSRLIPLWIVNGKVSSSKIMIAIDGSEYSLRAVDHLSLMLEQNSDIKITLFHVIPNLTEYCPIDFDNKEADNIKEIIIQGNIKCVENFFVHANRKFSEAGIQKNQIEIKEVRDAGNVGRAIADEVKTGNYGTVILGRSGINNAFFMGSVSRYVVNKVSACAVWLVF